MSRFHLVCRPSRSLANLVAYRRVGLRAPSLEQSSLNKQVSDEAAVCTQELCSTATVETLPLGNALKHYIIYKSESDYTSENIPSKCRPLNIRNMTPDAHCHLYSRPSVGWGVDGSSNARSLEACSTRLQLLPMVPLLTT